MSEIKFVYHPVNPWLLGGVIAFVVAATIVLLLVAIQRGRRKDKDQ